MPIAVGALGTIPLKYCCIVLRDTEVTKLDDFRLNEIICDECLSGHSRLISNSCRVTFMS